MRHPPSHAKQPLAAEKFKQGQHWQAEDGEMIAFNLLKQMHPEALKLVGANAGCDRCACLIEIRADFGLAQPSHAHARDRDFFEQYLAIARDRNRAIKFMTAAGERAELLCGLCPARRLAEKLYSERQCLVGADNISAR